MGQERNPRGRDPTSHIHLKRARSPDPLPSGIQRLVRLASVDPDFLDLLVLHRARLARVLRIDLTTSEERILAAVPDQKLRQMAERIAKPPVERRAFLGRIAAVAVMMVSGAGLGSACAPPRRSGADRALEVPEEPGNEASVLVEKEAGPPVERPRGHWVMPYGIKGPRVMPDPHLRGDATPEPHEKKLGCRSEYAGGYMPRTWTDLPRCPAPDKPKKPKKPKVMGLGVMFGFGGLGLRGAGKK